MQASSWVFCDTTWAQARSLTYHIAKLQAVRELMEKLATDLEKHDLTTQRELCHVCLFLPKACSS